MCSSMASSPPRASSRSPAPKARDHHGREHRRPATRRTAAGVRRRTGRAVRSLLVGHADHGGGVARAHTASLTRPTFAVRCRQTSAGAVRISESCGPSSERPGSSAVTELPAALQKRLASRTGSSSASTRRSSYAPARSRSARASSTALGASSRGRARRRPAAGPGSCREHCLEPGRGLHGGQHVGRAVGNCAPPRVRRDSCTLRRHRPRPRSLSHASEFELDDGTFTSRRRRPPCAGYTHDILVVAPRHRSRPRRERFGATEAATPMARDRHLGGASSTCRRKIAGVASFVHDLRFDAMLHGRMVRSHSPGARLVDCDESVAARLDGVEAVAS